MSVDKERIEEAKKILGDKAAHIIAREVPIEQWNEDELKGLSIFRDEKTPSMVWNKKGCYFKDFSSGNCYDIVNHFMRMDNVSFSQAVQKLFDLVGMEYSEDDFYDKASVRNKYKNHRFPHDEEPNNRIHVNNYMASRGISQATLDYCHVKESSNGNIAYQIYDIDGTHVATKYRVCHDATNRAHIKWFWQKPADSSDVLFGIDKVDITKPVLIVEGYNDCLACVESGYTNVVSIPGGANDLKWIEFNYETLSAIPEFIIWFDDDDTGRQYSKIVSDRLGTYKVKVVDIPSDVKNDIYEHFNQTTDKADANNVLMSCGQDAVLRIIYDAKDIPNPSLKKLFDFEPIDISQLPKISTGFKSLDNIVSGNFSGDFVVLTGRSGCVDCDTEFFNGTKWKKISEYTEGDKVLQYNEDGTAELVNPNYYIKEKQDTLYHFHTKYAIDQCLSDNHTVYYVDQKGENNKCLLSDIMNKCDENGNHFYGSFITSFDYGANGIDLSDDEIKLMVIVIAYGHFEKESNTNLCMVRICNGSIRNEFRKILNDCGIEYKETNDNIKYLKSYTFTFCAPRKESEYGEYWYGCSRHQLKVICETIYKWASVVNSDGLVTFVTGSKKSADFVQFAISACNKRAEIKEENVELSAPTADGNGKVIRVKSYIVIIYECNLVGLPNNRKFEQYKTKDGYMYCFNVPSHLLVLRRNNCIFVTGNCGKSTLTFEMCVISAIESGHKVMAFSGEASGPVFLGQLMRPLAGPRHIRMFDNSAKGIPDTYAVHPKAKEAIKEFYKDKIWIYDDNGEMETSSKYILDEMIYAYRKYGVDVFLLDNLMTISVASDAEDKYNSQTKFCLALKRFTRQYNVTVFLVAHAKKPQNGAVEDDMYSVAGAAEIVNLADRGYAIRVLNNDEEGYNSCITVIKDRHTGKIGRKVKLYYHGPSNTLFGDMEEVSRKHLWEDGYKAEYSKDFMNNVSINSIVIPEKSNQDEVFGSFPTSNVSVRKKKTDK